MAITHQLVDATPNRLRYLMTQDGVISSPPVVGDNVFQFTNAQLLADLATAVADADAGPSPMLPIFRVSQDGYGPIAAGAIGIATAHALLDSDDPGNGILGNDLVGRCVLDINGRSGTIAWSASGAVDAGFNLTARVESEVGVAATAYLDIIFRDSYDF